MAVEKTTLDYWKPDGVTELVKRGADVIAHNAQLSDDLHTAGQSAATALAGRVAAAEQSVTVHGSQLAGLSAQVAAVATPFNIGIDLDGVPFYQDGASGLSLAADTDGVPYFL